MNILLTILEVLCYGAVAFLLWALISEMVSQ